MKCFFFIINNKYFITLINKYNKLDFSRLSKLKREEHLIILNIIPFIIVNFKFSLIFNLHDIY